MKKVLSILLCLCMLVAEMLAVAEEEANKHNHCYCGGYIEGGGHTSHSDITYREWNGKNKIQYNNGVAYVYLKEDVAISSALNIGGGKTLYLCLNGHSVKMTGEDRVINVGVGGKLRLCDCKRSADAKICGGRAEYGAGIHNNGTVEMYGGIITRNDGGYGGGVYNNVNFYLYGGDIYDNKALYGGGVWNDNDSASEFVMYEGTISLNTASCGGAIWNNDGGNLILKGGTINHNAVGTGGGGVWNNGGTTELDGSTIIENSAKYGGGIWNNGGILNIKSGNISKNIATADHAFTELSYGGGIWDNGEGYVYMTGGEITFNKALAGGGVWCNDGSNFVMTGGVIAENEADAGGGIYIQRSSETAVPGNFRLGGKAGIVYNYAHVAGGGAYIKGILNTEGEGEIILNRCPDENYAQYVAEECGEIYENASMPTQFIDVPADAYFLEPVKWALENGITTGTSDITFSPDDKCNVGQILTFLWRAAGEPQVETSPLIADVYEDDYYYMAAYWGQSLGLFKTALYPNFSCNRIGAVKFIWYAAGKPECKTQLKFTDLDDEQYDETHEAVAWAVEQGITTGTSETTFSPGKTCTRAEIVTFLYRAFK